MNCLGSSCSRPEVSAEADDAVPLLQLRGIEKRFPGMIALRGVDLDLRAGEVLALLGENGAGKSTLIRVLAGAHLPDAGEIWINGSSVSFRNPTDARRAGVAVIHQEFTLVPALSARENIFLGREPVRAGLIRQRYEAREAERLLLRIGVKIDIEAPCRELSVAHQQCVEIAKALLLKARILVMDEPTAALTKPEVERLFAVIQDLKRRGMGIIYVSHRLDEIFALADRVTVLRDGARAGSCPIGAVNREQLVEMMVGRKLEQEFPARRAAIGEARLVVKNLRREPKVRGVSFEIRRGEVLALTGLAGAGRTEVARLVFGADRRDAGSIEIDRRNIKVRNCRDAIRAGIALVTEDRKGQGLVLGQSARENFSLPNLARFTRFGLLRKREENGAFHRFARSLDIRLSGPDELARNLSGGNQQKVVLAKWLQRNCEVILLDEPTRGIDVAAKYEVYQLMNQMASEGKAILLISSELPEVLGMSDRILVMHEGRIVGEITNPARATPEQIMALSLG